ncbi:cation:proton antiporter regulatory subunit [Natronorubrum sulfidifaciens]|uniref:RCK C-terminal domain-containing protein n=1 Tax=Natronorubrum sulfidifaciens JCM 14089 TaxID=1230460 RepID=L9VY52_9EURY|nr:TrkA C-terminal domain-containing protein [Natronorubrum sulfidifaciens]ELY42110.1 hypothetical protein C495_16218 [Natronorubrum sulfidifaciens JCM 14089]
MPITETDLPGVGKKFEIDLEDGKTLVIVTHNTGRRDVFLKADDDADSERLFELSDQLARTVGTILEGAYFQPIKTEDKATTLGDGTNIEWFDVPADSPLEGRSLAEVLADGRIHVAIVAVQRGEDVIPASEPEKRLDEGDTIIAVGTNEDLEQFKTLLSGDDGSGLD